jgi:SAM-dependent methyltransferase
LTPDFDERYFEDLYAADPDPWNYKSSPYEARKYAATLGVLPRAKYQRGLELGCSIGVLTSALAKRCNALAAVDTSQRALAIARRHCPASHVTFVHAHLPHGDWGTPFDLLVLSEVLYYLQPDAIRSLAQRLARCAKPGAHVVLVHWTGKTNYPLTADEATGLLRSAMPVSVLEETTCPEYRLDLWQFR